jgi:hypothetical protein
VRDVLGGELARGLVLHGNDRFGGRARPDDAHPITGRSGCGLGDRLGDRLGIASGDGRDEQERQDESSDATARSMPSSSDRCCAPDLWHVAMKAARGVPRGRERNIEDETAAGRSPGQIRTIGAHATACEDRCETPARLAISMRPARGDLEQRA